MLRNWRGLKDYRWLSIMVLAFLTIIFTLPILAAPPTQGGEPTPIPVETPDDFPTSTVETPPELDSLPLTATPTISEPSSPPQSSSSFGRDTFLELPFTATQEETDIVALLEADLTTDNVAAWSQIVFQSFRTGNWEIYLADGAGNNQHRLTGDKADDLYPHLNRGTTQIVFVSKRTGNYEIFRMNTDGTNIVQLTFNNVDDLYPRWSPNGQQIAFQSYPDGVAEIYLMNADGSGQTRITTDGAGSGYPDWSPDGTQLAFASLRGGKQAIWTMKTNGSDAQRIGDPQPQAQHPVWSPDGQQIAFSAGGSDTSFLNIWLVNADGSQQQNIYQPTGVNTDSTVVNSWSPDGQQIAFTYISTTFDGNQTHTHAWLAKYSMTDRTADSFPQSGADFAPAWQTSDNQPPQVALNTLPTYTPYTDLTLRWNGVDNAAGLKNYDLQFRNGNGPWTDWLVDTKGTLTIFGGKPGDQLSFRVRAEDNAYNVTPWSNATPIVQTRLYGVLTGSVTDSRAIPLPAATLNVNPAATKPLTIDTQGYYNAQLTQFGQVQLQASHPGFGSLPQASRLFDRDQSLDLVLPSNDNLIQNGQFEANGGSLTGWVTGGSLSPTVNTAQSHTGNAAVMLGSFGARGVMTDTVPLGSPGPFTAPEMAVGPDGTIHLAYTNYAEFKVFYLARRPDGSWTNREEIGSGDHATLALTPNGEVHVVWTGSGIYHRVRRTNNTWSTAKRISPNDLTTVYPPDIAVDSQGGVHLVYGFYLYLSYQYGVYYQHLLPSGQWQVPELVDLKVGFTTYYPKIAIGLHDGVNVLWGSESPSDTTSFLYLRQRTSSGQWTTPEEVTTVKGPGATSPLWARAFAIDRFGNMHIIWLQPYNNYYNNRLIGQSWGVPWAYNNDHFTNLTVDSSGTTYLALEDIEKGELNLQHKTLDGPWSTPDVLGEAASAPVAMRVDHEDNLHLIYETLYNGLLHYYQGQLPANAAASTLSQSVTIPATLHQPTLSFLYRLNGVRGSTGSSFEVSISNGTTTTTVFATSQNQDWSHAWVDLTPWSGQAITLTFKAFNPAGMPPIQLYLDEVTIGAWLTPVPQTASPNHLDSGTSGLLTIHGQNFIAPLGGEQLHLRLGGLALSEVTWVNDTTITGKLPTTLPPGRHDLWVVNPGGQIGVLGNAVIVGKQLYLPAMARP